VYIYRGEKKKGKAIPVRAWT